MDKKLRRSLVFLFLLLYTTVANSWGQESTAARFLYIQPSARAQAMGGSSVAMWNHSFEGNNNPALMAYSPWFCVSGMYQNPISITDNMQLYGTISCNIDSFMAVSASANLYTFGRYERLTNNGTALGIYNSNAQVLNLSLAKALNDNIAVGAGVSYLHVNLAPATLGSAARVSSSLLFNIGALYRNLLPSTTIVSDSPSVFASWRYGNKYVHRGVSVGVAMNNLGSQIKSSEQSEGDSPPSNFLLGVAYSPVRTVSAGLQLSLDIEKRLFESGLVNVLHAGGELEIARILCLRAGYNANVSNSEASYFSLGAGLRFWFLHLNIARYTRTLLPSWQFDASIIWEL